MGREKSNIRSTQRLIALTLRDFRDFDLRLRELWPDIRYLDKDDWAIHDEKRVARPRPPERTDVPYVDGLGDARSSYLRVWREPEGWEPVWLPHEYGGIYIANKPRLQFRLYLSSFYPRFPGWDLRQFSSLMEGRVWGEWHQEDKEHAAFFRKVLYEIGKMCTNVLVWKDDPDQVPGRTRVWVGPHAVEWARSAPDHVIGGDLRPPPLNK